MRSVIFLCLAAFLAGDLSAQSLIESIQRLGTFEKDFSKWDEKQYFDASKEALRLWKSATDEEKARFAHKMFLVHFRRAEILASSGDFTGAAVELTEEGKMQKMYDGRLEYSTKSPETFFENLAKLQAGVAQTTGSDPLAGLTDYLFRKQGQKYIVARQELDPEVKGITVDGINESETLAQVLEVSAQDGQTIIERTRWVVGPKGKVEETLQRATREVSFDEDGRLSAKPISAPVLGGSEPPAPQPSATPSAATPAPAVPVLTAMPAASPKPTTPVVQTPAVPFERSAPVWPWVVGIAALAVIALLVWKRRA